MFDAFVLSGLMNALFKSSKLYLTHPYAGTETYTALIAMASEQRIWNFGEEILVAFNSLMTLAEQVYPQQLIGPTGKTAWWIS